MFFIASKVFWLLVRPEVIIAALVVLAAVLLIARRVRWGRRVAVLAAVAVISMSFFALWRPLMTPLENAYPVNPDMAEAPAGIIVLGGSELTDLTGVWGQPQVNSAGERFIEALALAHRFPEATVMFAGGNGSLRRERSGSEVAEALFLRVGLPPERLLFERDSRNTAENAAFLKAQLGDRQGPWVLITSAFHMPRSVATFCAAGWTDIVPWPVDHRTGGRTPGFSTNLEFLNIAVKEWIGMVAYRATGRAALPQNTPECLAAMPEPTILSSSE